MNKKKERKLTVGKSNGIESTSSVTVRIGLDLAKKKETYSKVK